MSRSVIAAVLAAFIAVLTVAAYFVTTSKLEGRIYKDVEQRVAKSQELLIQNSSLEMLRLLKHAEAMALDPKLREALGNSGAEDTEATPPNPVLAEDVFKKFRASLKQEEAQPDIMAMTDDEGKLIALMSGGTPVTSPVPDSYLKGGKIKYPALEASIENQITTSEIWDYEGSGAMKVTVAPILGDGISTTLGTVLVAYAITAPEAMKQHKLLGAHVVYFYGESIHATSFESAKEQQAPLGKALFEGGLAKAALDSDKGLGPIKSVSYNGDEYLATSGRLPRYSSKALATDYPSDEAGAMVLISLSAATSSVGAAGFTILLVGLIGILMVFVAISLTSKRILHPLEEIEIGVNDIINGNLDRTFEPVGSDLDGLANALNVMLARLLGRPEPGEEEFDEDGNIIRNEVQLPRVHQSGRIDLKQAEAEALAAEPVATYLHRIHGEFVAASAAIGDNTPSSFDDFVKSLQENEGVLKQKYSAREVRFKVVSEGGKVTLKPLPIM